MNSRYKNPDNDPRGIWKTSDLSVRRKTEKDIYEIKTPSGRIVLPPLGRSWGVNKENFQILLAENRIWFGKNGDSVPQLKRFLTDVKQGMTSMTIWKYTEVGHTQDAMKESKSIDSKSVFPTPKPERLMERILTLATNDGDLVLDSFLGSGTTAAVAHKMGRKYIGIEMGDHAYTHCKVRLDKVIDGSDQGGISVSKEVYDLKEDDLKDLELDIDEVKIFNKILITLGKETDLIPKDVLKELKKKTRTQKIKSESVWSGGGGYRFYELAPTLINEDKFGEPIINKDYSPDMLASAVALHEGFKYQPSEDIFWKQSQNNENSYLFVTTRHIDSEYLNSIKDTMEENEYLIIACKSFDKSIEYKYPNIKIKKIPQMLLDKCEFGVNDYNLNIINPPTVEDEEEDYEE